MAKSPAARVVCEKELNIIDRFSDKLKNALDIGVYRGVYSYKFSKFFTEI